MRDGYRQLPSRRQALSASVDIGLELGVCAGLQNLVKPAPCLILDHPKKESLTSNQRTLGDRARLELASADFRRAPVALPALEKPAGTFPNRRAQPEEGVCPWTAYWLQERSLLSSSQPDCPETSGSYLRARLRRNLA
jgi:hypothetical protein